ncbi:MAG: hypothetical protein K8L97_00060 [Anaerolineae bacterium]|nr:hypothetical protein [Anaerolineae bacterium]
MTLDESIQRERELIETIKRNSQQQSNRALLVILKTFAAPLVVFLAVGGVGVTALRYVESTFGTGGGVSLLTAISVTLVMIAATVSAWRWSERQFGGAAFVGRLFRVTRQVLEAEQAIERAKAKPQPELRDLTEIESLTQAAWATYAEAMRGIGLSVERHQD